MKEKGCGGYFMHARRGLLTEYLSERWMECIAATLDEGKQQDMESWLYDEDRWPSGFAGGLVPAQNEGYIIRTLTCRPLGAEGEGGCNDQETVAVFDLDLDGAGRLRAAAPVGPPFPAEDSSGRLYAFTAVRMARSDRYNGEAYVDLLNPEVTDAFLRCTYDVYAERFGKEYGEFMPGIFTDEPNYLHGRGVPWTAALPAYFRERNGYDLIPKLPLLFFDGEGCEKVRYDFWRTCTQRFVEAFTQRVYEHCERHGLALTGHFLAEDTLLAQMLHIGAAMPHYEFMQVPGIDHLRRWIRYPLARKQVSSAAQQFGRNRILCEIYGTSGHSMSFEDQKWIADAHFAMGVTFMDQHLTLYSMPGDRKRDYPPTFSEHQPYWPHYRLMNDYLARCSYAMQQGVRQCDLLVLHPIASVWAAYRAPCADRRPDNARAEAYDNALAGLVDHLHAIQRDFDLGDEMIMARHARVEGDRFVVGKMRYRLVLMPPGLTWSAKTVALVREFLDAGGRVVVLGEPPALMDGEPADYAALLAHPGVSRAENAPEALRAALDALLPPDLIARDEQGGPLPSLLYNHRLDGDEHIYFLANTSRTETCRAVVSLRATGGVTEWDPADGSTRPHPAEVRDGRLVLRTVLPPAGSRLFVVRPDEAPLAAAEAEPRRVETLPLHDGWRFERTHPNSRTLDFASYRVGDEPFSERLPVWKIRHALKKRFGLDRYAACQPWVLRKRGVKVPGRPSVTLRFDFDVQEPPSEGTGLWLVLEQARRWRVTINGRAVSTETDEWHWDRQFARVDIRRHVAAGANRIEMQTTYDWDTEIEEVYLVGDFGVVAGSDGVYRLAGEPDHLDDGDWVAQGYPFYAGNMIYRREVTLRPEPGRRYRLRLCEPKGTLFRVSVNDAPWTPLCWQPWEADITEHLVEGANRIAIEVCGSLRNTFGPLHHADGDSLLWTGPAQFTDEEKWVDEYQFAPTGLLGGAEIVVLEG